MSNTRYAGFWLRFVAYIIDYIIVQVIQSTLLLPFLGFLGFSFAVANGFDMSAFEEFSGENSVAFILMLIGTVLTFAALALTIEILYFSFMEASHYQGSVGKLVLGLKVTDLNGNRMDLGKCLLRNVCKLFSALLCFIGYIMAGFTAKKQALHDMLAGALVVQK